MKKFTAHFTDKNGKKVIRKLSALHINQAQEIAKSLANKNEWKRGEVFEGWK